MENKTKDELIGEFKELTSNIAKSYERRDGERDVELEFAECVEDILNGAFRGINEKPNRDPDQLRRMALTFSKMIVDSAKQLNFQPRD